MQISLMIKLLDEKSKGYMDKEDKKMAKILVAYFSATGTTGVWSIQASWRDC